MGASFTCNDSTGLHISYSATGSGVAVAGGKDLLINYEGITIKNTEVFNDSTSRTITWKQLFNLVSGNS